MKKILAGVFAFVLLISIIPGVIAQEASTAGSTASVEASQPKVVQESSESGQRVLIEMPFEEKGQITMKEIIVTVDDEEEEEAEREKPSNCGDGLCADMTCQAIGCPAAETPESCPEDCGPRAKVIGEPIVEPALPPEDADTAQETVTGRVMEKVVEVKRVRSYTVVVDAPMPERVRGATEETATGEIVEEETVSGGAGKGVIGLPVSTKAIAGPVPIAAPRGIEVKIEAAEGYTAIESGEVRATTRRRISVRENKIYVTNDADERKEIAIMPSRVKEIIEARAERVPSTAAELEVEAVETPSGILRPKITVTKIELAVEEEKPVYNIESEEDGKLFAFIPVKLKIKSKMDAVSGIVEQTKRPWWSFLVFGQTKKVE